MPNLDLPSSSHPQAEQGMDIDEISILPQASVGITITSSQISRNIGGIKVIDSDLDCLRYPNEQINSATMNAYTNLVPNKDHSLIKAGCVIISSLVPRLIHGSTSCSTTLETIVSEITKKKMLAFKCWAFPLYGEDSSHWVLGWVDWSRHEIGLFDSLGKYPNWARKDVQHAAAGLEYWLKHEAYPEIESLEQRFKDWRIHHHSPRNGQRQKDGWSSGIFVMMAMNGLSDLDFSCVHQRKSSFYKLLTEEINPIALQFLYPLELLRPIIWQDQAQSSSVIQTAMRHLNQIPTNNLFYRAIHSLDRRGNLLRVYTQNIDAMEKTASLLSFGVPNPSEIDPSKYLRCIPLLGRLDQMSCTLGCKMVPSSTFLDRLTSDGLPICTTCKSYNQHGHKGIRHPNIVVYKEDQPNLDSILAHDKNLVDVVLAIGIRPCFNISDIIKHLSQAAQSRTSIGVLSSILMDQNQSTLEKTGIPALFQVSWKLDLQDFFGRITRAAYHDGIHNPASNTMVISRRLLLRSSSTKQSDDEDTDDEYKWNGGAAL
ncbi:hypothetical protein BDR07DRAFT_1376169 [Suillus spraguei]|nr:hypothetical protein BDR07DRAFT_1376169 [Suillus spraguei]